MSVAFTREDSAQTAQEIALPERPVSPHPNLVTEAGLRALERALDECRAALEAAQRIEDMGERRRAGDLAVRDMGYFSERSRGALLRPAPSEFEVVAFGHRVTFRRDDDRRQTFRIVGEDEADPRSGSISYVSPMARALMGKRVGDFVDLGGHEIEVMEIG
jgi:transcription elongation GreA/GreB family factor